MRHVLYCLSLVPVIEKVIVFPCRYAGDENDEDLSRTIAVILSENREMGH
jgi:hypothetical protein